MAKKESTKSTDEFEITNLNDPPKRQTDIPETISEGSLDNSETEPNSSMKLTSREFTPKSISSNKSIDEFEIEGLTPKENKNENKGKNSSKFFKSPPLKSPI